MVWPERVVLGIIGRRPDELSLVWAVGLAWRWQTRLRVVAGYSPPIATGYHVVTAHEMQAAREHARQRVGARIREAVAELPTPIDVDLTLVTFNQLDHELIRQGRQADLALFSIVPTGLFAGRQRTRARRIAGRLTCPVSLGPGQAVEPVGLGSA